MCDEMQAHSSLSRNLRHLFGLDRCLSLLAPLRTRLLFTVFRGVYLLLGDLFSLPPQLVVPQRQQLCGQLHVRAGLLGAGRGALHAMPLRHLQEGHWLGRRVHCVPCCRAVVADEERRCCGLSLTPTCLSPSFFNDKYAIFHLILSHVLRDVNKK
jgi:hypothetical protein